MDVLHRSWQTTFIPVICWCPAVQVGAFPWALEVSIATRTYSSSEKAVPWPSGVSVGYQRPEYYR